MNTEKNVDMNTEKNNLVQPFLKVDTEIILPFKSKFVSDEENTLNFIKSLFEPNFVCNLDFIKSGYRFSICDFLILNKQNLKHIYIETKNWLKRKPTYISIDKINLLKKNYEGKIFLILSHNCKYYWLLINDIDWSKIHKINVDNSNKAEDWVYVIGELLSTDIELLETKMRIFLVS